MKSYVLFLAGRYQECDFAFYRRLARGRIRVAVDGGYRFFKRARVRPDLLIGDMDSLGGVPRKLPRGTEAVVFPTDKDQTDAELALDYCLDAGAKEIDLVQPSMGDPDHFLATLYLLTREPTSAGSRKTHIRLVGPGFEAFYLKNGMRRFEHAVGSTVSVIPLSAAIRLSWSGTAYDVREARMKRGQSRSARNRITSRKATARVKGEAFVVRIFPRRR